jgi:hypothetical protein
VQIAKEAGLHDMGWMGSKSYIDNKLKVRYYMFPSCSSCGFDTKKSLVCRVRVPLACSLCLPVFVARLCGRGRRSASKRLLEQESAEISRNRLTRARALAQEL